MSRLMQWFVRAYLPLAVRHVLVDGYAHAARTPSTQPRDVNDRSSSLLA